MIGLWILAGFILFWALAYFRVPLVLSTAAYAVLLLAALYLQHAGPFGWIVTIALFLLIAIPLAGLAASVLTRWLVGTRRMQQAAFASVENLPDARAVLWVWGEQLVPDFLSRAGQEPAQAEQYVERALRDHRTILVLDNCESVLPPVGWQA